MNDVTWDTLEVIRWIETSDGLYSDIIFNNGDPETIFTGLYKCLHSDSNIKNINLDNIDWEYVNQDIEGIRELNCE